MRVSTILEVKSRKTVLTLAAGITHTDRQLYRLPPKRPGITKVRSQINHGYH